MPESVTSNSHDSKQIAFDAEQLEVINEASGRRQLVEAGPGTGKTAVACARIVKLLRDGINPSAILMISFTRAAVREMKDRIKGWQNVESAGGLKISTVDQTAFRFARGSGSDAADLMQGFDVTIRAAIDQLKVGQGDIISYVESLKHVLVDEAQDLTDERAEFVEVLIGAIRKECGVTVLADSCQAIYGFTHDQGEDTTNEPRLFLDYCKSSESGFVGRSLTMLHRTKDSTLADFFGATRRALTAGTGRKALEGVIEQVSGGGNGLGDKIENFSLKHSDLVLFRKRAQALHAANFFGAPHRLRLPGYPAPIFAWVALCLSQHVGHSLTREEFFELWSRQVPSVMADGWTPDRAYEALRTVVGSTKQIEMRKLRAALGHTRPPIELCYPDFGGIGPVFSTIHASKGREADRVVLMLPRNVDKALERMKTSGVEEEARVYYVGATRVRRDFAHGIASTLVDSRKLRPDNEREIGIPLNQYKKAKFQFGLEGDISEIRLISSRESWCGDDELAKERQAFLIQIWRNCLESGQKIDVTGKRFGIKAGAEWHYAYRFEVDAHVVGFSSDQLIFDLMALAKAVGERLGGKHKAPKIIPYLQLVGLRTVAVSDEASAGEMSEPYSESGFFLAPMITGFANVNTHSFT